MTFRKDSEEKQAYDGGSSSGETEATGQLDRTDSLAEVGRGKTIDVPSNQAHPDLVTVKQQPLYGHV